MKQISLEPAYLLHSRNYRETSLLIELFCQNHGRVALVARGARKKRQVFSLLQPFVPLLISAKGRGSLLNLTDVELAHAPNNVMSNNLIMALSLNKLIYKNLAPYDAHCDLYNYYAEVLQSLSVKKDKDKVLLLFSKRLLQCLGYELQLDKTFDRGEDIRADCFYKYDPKRGAFAVSNKAFVGAVAGSNLLNLATEQLLDSDLEPIKIIMRQALLSLV